MGQEIPFEERKGQKVDMFAAAIPMRPMGFELDRQPAQVRHRDLDEQAAILFEDLSGVLEQQRWGIKVLQNMKRKSHIAGFFGFWQICKAAFIHRQMKNLLCTLNQPRRPIHPGNLEALLSEMSQKFSASAPELKNPGFFRLKTEASHIEKNFEPPHPVPNDDRILPVGHHIGDHFFPLIETRGDILAAWWNSFDSLQPASTAADNFAAVNKKDASEERTPAQITGWHRITVD